MPAYYANSVQGFLADSASAVFATMVNANDYAGFLQVEHSQTAVWRDTVDFLRESLVRIAVVLAAVSQWGLLLEFPIPRRQKRADLILLAGDLILVVEFKSTEGTASGLLQVEDYALDMANFHAGSRGRCIIPMVVALQTHACVGSQEQPGTGVLSPRACSHAEFPETLLNLFQRHCKKAAPQISWQEFNLAPYHPIPSIIEAAIAIFSGMEVREIAHAHSDPHNLTRTVDSLTHRIHVAATAKKKIICFVTGVPGSGKTLAGLRAVHDPRVRQLTATDPAFFSGNGPLVKILREALVRDATAKGEREGDARRRINTTIQNVHVLARESYDDPRQLPPHEHVMVFDEAQRAWNAKRNQRKFKRNISEPEMILSIMDRHPDWAVLVCLIGGGQEIHDGEAGLAEWGKTLSERFRHWDAFTSPEAIRGGPSVAGSCLFANGPPSELCVTEDPALHLPVSTRSYRAQAVTEWSNALLSGQTATAHNALRDTRDFPVYVTRDLSAARRWLRLKTRGTDRSGLVASSGAARLRAEGLETSTAFHREYPYQYWFLNPPTDVRSSYQLEVVATEFEIQGLELDWVGLCWGGDFLWNAQRNHWDVRAFAGTKWRTVKDAQAREFITNSYRVLLTRARQGMIIWIPIGDSSDPTREPGPFDATAEVLLAAGLKPLDAMI
jgi:hypothetical protein